MKIDEVRKDCRRAIDNPQTAGERRIARLALDLLDEHEQLTRYRKVSTAYSLGQAATRAVLRARHDLDHAAVVVERLMEEL